MLTKALLAALSFAVCLSAVIASGNHDETIRRDTTAYFDALRAENYDRLAELSYGRIVESTGGRENFVRMLEMADQMRKAQQVEYGDAMIISLSDVVDAGPQLHVIVKALQDRVSPAGTKEKTMFLMGISEDGGKSWTFVDAERVTPANKDKLFPEFNDSLQLPNRGEEQ